MQMWIGWPASCPSNPAPWRMPLSASSELRDVYQSDDSIHKLVDTARALEGTVHHVSTHAAGVVISSEPLTEYVPLQRLVRGDESSEIAMTQYAMEPVAILGLLKMDFLGLTNLTILDRAVKVVEQTRGIKIDLHRLSLDDQNTFELLSSGKTTDIFQLESAGMQRYIKELKPSSLGDIAAMIALYRPGPMEHIETFIEAKHGRAPIKYPHPSLKDILEETHGVIVYQDQVLLILQAFAGYSLGQADTVRKAMGKKIPELMRKEREGFIDGAVGKGFTREASPGGLQPHRALRRLRLQQGPQRKLRPHLLLDRLLQGQLPCGIYGLGAKLSPRPS